MRPGRAPVGANVVGADDGIPDCGAADGAAVGACVVGMLVGSDECGALEGAFEVYGANVGGRAHSAGLRAAS